MDNEPNLNGENNEINPIPATGAESTAPDLNPVPPAITPEGIVAPVNEPASEAPEAPVQSADPTPVLAAETTEPTSSETKTEPILAGKIEEPENAVGSKNFEVQVIGRDMIRLPNITLSSAIEPGMSYLEVKLPQGYRLHCELEHCADGALSLIRTSEGFKVVPEVDVDKGGTWKFPVDCDDPNGTVVAVMFMLTANPDSRSLWDVKEPDQKDWIFPEDANRIASKHQTKEILNTGLMALGVSRRGRYHELGATFRDDSIGMWSDEETGRYVFMVADGAGSAQYSREGSRRVIETIKSKLKANLKPELWDADPDKAESAVGDILVRLTAYAYTELVKYINAENANRAEGEKFVERDFSTTFLVAALKKDADGSVRIVSFSIGDGAIAVFDGEKAMLMCAPDGDKFSGGTRFVTTPDVWAAFKADRAAFCKSRVFYAKLSADEAAKMSLYLMSDGVSDPKFECDAGLNDSAKWKALDDEINKAAFAGEMSLEERADKFIEWLHFWSKGNYDDRSIFLIRNNPDYKFEKPEAAAALKGEEVTNA